jgi:hypothetical protein
MPFYACCVLFSLSFLLVYIFLGICAPTSHLAGSQRANVALQGPHKPRGKQIRRHFAQPGHQRRLLLGRQARRAGRQLALQLPPDARLVA